MSDPLNPESPQYVMATSCGHRVWMSETASAGMVWCYPCRNYVGLIVTRADPPTAKTVAE